MVGHQDLTKLSVITTELKLICVQYQFSKLTRHDFHLKIDHKLFGSQTLPDPL